MELFKNGPPFIWQENEFHSPNNDLDLLLVFQSGFETHLVLKPNSNLKGKYKCMHYMSKMPKQKI